MPGKQALAAFAAVSQKKYGPRSTGRADATATGDRHVPLGPIHLDYGLGGGLRIGWITSFYGEKSGGKTTTAYKAVAKFQSLCRNCLRPAKNIVAVPPPMEVLEKDKHARWGAEGQCTCYAEGLYRPEVPEFRDDKDKKLAENSKKYKEAKEAWHEALMANSYEETVACWIDVEQSFSTGYATAQGVDCKRLQLQRPESAEDGIDMLHALVCTVEVDFVVLDSIAQLAPNKEIESSTEDWQQGLQARLSNKMARLLVRDSSMVANQDRSVTQIWINQTREKIGQMWGDPTTKPGGKGQEFAVHAEVRFYGSKQELTSEQYGAKDKGEVVTIPISETFKFKITKNKTKGTRGVEGTYTQRLKANDAGPACSLIEIDDVFKLAMHYLVEQDPKLKTLKLGGQEYPNQKQMLMAFRDDPELVAATKTVLLERMLQGFA